jgi:hypothetical protein
MSWLRLVMTVCFLTPAQAGAGEKSVPLDYYPEQYKTITADDWSRARQVLDGTLAFEDETALRNADAGIQAWFVLARLEDIEWPDSKKKEAGNYLKGYVQGILQGKGFIKDFRNLELPDKTFLRFDPIFLPHKAIWVMFALDEQLACETAKQSLGDASRCSGSPYCRSLHSAILWTMEKKYRSDRVFDCLRAIQKDFRATAGPDDERVESFLLKRELFKLNDEAKAWNSLWEKFHRSHQGGVLTSRVQWIWYRNMLLMMDVYPEPDVSVLLDMAERTPDFSRKYVFLYGATFLINSKTSLAPRKVDAKEKARLKRLVAELYERKNEKGGEASASGDEYDFLKAAFESVR